VAGSYTLENKGGSRKLTISNDREQTLYTMGSSFFRSQDGGKNWQIIEKNGCGTFVFSPSEPNILYANCRRYTENKEHVAKDEGHFIKSTDGGNTWWLVGKGPPENTSALAVDPNDSNKIYAGGGLCGGLYYSNNGTRTWLELDYSSMSSVIKSYQIFSKEPP
jgi:photosystem II stability/assembly factor-like uncharacterized protein